MNKINKFKLNCNLDTNYKVAKVLKVHQSSVTTWEKDDLLMNLAIINLINYVTEYYELTGKFL